MCNLSYIKHIFVKKNQFIIVYCCTGAYITTRDYLYHIGKKYYFKPFTVLPHVAVLTLDNFNLLDNNHVFD